jgi:FKBP-type peptidyl-prolyl cis-trans isomerase
MKYVVSSILLSFLIFSCSSTSEETVKLKTAKDKISYSLGADHARAISESNDPNFKKYNVNQIIKGFNDGVINDKTFDKKCQNTLMQMYKGGSFNEKMNDEGSLCIGKLSGAIFHSSWKKNKGLSKLDIQMVKHGFAASLLKKDTILDKTTQATLVQNFMFDMYKLNGEKLIEKAKKIKGAYISPLGFVIQTLKEGNGTSPAKGDDVLAHYILMNANGDTIQNSHDFSDANGGKMSPFSLGSVIAGWQEGIPLMKKGGSYKLFLPYHLAYGEQGMFNQQRNTYDISPFQSLVFEIQLLDHGKPGKLPK